MMINTLIEMEKYSQAVLNTHVSYMSFAYILFQKREILLCIGLMLCDSGQKYD